MPLSREQARELDRRAIEELGMPGILLMENAGRGVVEVIRSLRLPGPIHILCGKGNNGGDGYVIARHLHLAKVDVVVHRCCQPNEITGDAAVMHGIVEKMNIPLIQYETVEKLAEDILDAHWLVDALLGTGLEGVVRSPYAEIILMLNRSHKPIWAVDIPSGLDADTGEPLGCAIVAQHTVTFVEKKQGMLRDEAWLHTGEVHVAHIGVSPQ
jgi:NAD(P)H-hydrate epimerase